MLCSACPAAAPPVAPPTCCPVYRAAFCRPRHETLTALPAAPLACPRCSACALRQRPGHPDARPDSPALHTNPYEFRYLTEFQSHEPEFDYLKSLEIEEKINKVRWVRGRCGGRTHMLLTTNDKTIKLWKVCVCGGGGGGGGVWHGWVEGWVGPQL